jgi:hypothetical protein
MQTENVPYGFIYQTVNKINGMKYVGASLFRNIKGWFLKITLQRNKIIQHVM